MPPAPPTRPAFPHNASPVSPRHYEPAHTPAKIPKTSPPRSFHFTSGAALYHQARSSTKTKRGACSQAPRNKFRFSSLLEVELCGQLYQPGSKGITGHSSKQTRVNVRARQVEVDMVERVLRLQPQLKPHPFGKGNILVDPQVSEILAWPVYGIPAGIPKCAHSRLLKRRGIEV